MPIMEVHLPAGRLDKTAKAELAKRLTEVLIRMEGGADTHGGRAFAWVLFTEVPEDDWWVGGSTGGEFVSPPGKFLVHVTIPEGYMNQAHKAEVQRWVTEEILAVTGAPAGSGQSILVVIDEVTEGNWAAAGRTISLASIAGTVGLAKSGDRFAWVEAYFAAKARQFASAGYPADTGGLLPQASAVMGS